MRGTTLLGIVLLAVVACTAAIPESPDWRTDPHEPYPFTTPVPPLAETSIDGIYDRDPTDTYEGEWAKCRRCPPYFLDRGRTTLTIDRGRWQNLHRVPVQETRGHLTIDGDRLLVFNDPICPTDRGEYRFRLEGDLLTLEVIDDPCVFGQRELDLTRQPWKRLGEAPDEWPDPGGGADADPSREFKSQ
jgi:hypothetical protein